MQVVDHVIAYFYHMQFADVPNRHHWSAMYHGWAYRFRR